jgi:diacylglycerol kinase family enzyme
MYRSIHLIVNPVSGRRRVDAMLARLNAEAARRKVTLSILRTQAPGHAIELARDHANDGELVVAVGGDGTVAEVIAGVVGQPGHVAVLPIGTENLLAKELGFRCNERAFWTNVDFGRPAAIDVGECNQRPFVSIVGVGFDGLAVNLLHGIRRGHISHLNWVGPLIRTVFEYTYPSIRVIADGRPVFEGPGLAYVGNIARYALGLRIVPDARPDDGVLNLCVFPCRGHADLIAHALHVVGRRYRRNSGICAASCTDVRIESEQPVPVQCDGDVADPLPIRVRLTGQRVTLCLPPPE